MVALQDLSTEVAGAKARCADTEKQVCASMPTSVRLTRHACHVNVFLVVTGPQSLLLSRRTVELLVRLKDFSQSAPILPSDTGSQRGSSCAEKQADRHGRNFTKLGQLGDHGCCECGKSCFLIPETAPFVSAKFHFSLQFVSDSVLCCTKQRI